MIMRVNDTRILQLFAGFGDRISCILCLWFRKFVNMCIVCAA